MNARSLWASMSPMTTQLAPARSLSPRRRIPPRASPPPARRPSPPSPARRPSPPKAAPSPARTQTANQAYKLGVKMALNKLSSNNWRQKAERAYEAFKNAGLTRYYNKNMWIKNVKRIYANYKGKIAHGQVYGMGGGRHYASQSDPDYIPSNHPRYETLRRIRNNIQI